MAVEFTGKGLFVPTSDAEANRAFERLGQAILDSEKQKNALALSNQKFLLDNTNIDPVQLLSTVARTDQEAALEGFNNKWAKIFKERKGNLTMLDKMNLQQDRQMIEARQQRWKQNEQQFMQDYNLARRDIGKNVYDHEHFKQAYDNFIRTGEYDPGALRLRPINADAYFMKLPRPQGFTHSQSSRGVYQNGNIVGTTTETYGTPQEADDLIKAHVLNNPQLAEAEANDFQSLPQSKQTYYLDKADANNDGVIDPQERQNAVILFAQDRHRGQVMHTDIKSSSRPESANKYVYINGNRFSPVESRPADFKDAHYDEFYAGNKTQTFSVLVPTKGVRVVGDPSAQPNSGKIKRLIYAGYIGDTDELVFYVPAADYDFFKGDNVAIKRTDLPSGMYDKIPVIKDGKVTTIGEIAKQEHGTQSTAESTTVKKVSFPDYVKKPGGNKEVNVNEQKPPNE